MQKAVVREKRSTAIRPPPPKKTEVMDDELLDEIDELLEENAMVTLYIQRGGQ